MTAMWKRVAAVALAVVVLAGCGHAAGSGPQTVLSHSEFVAQANRACEEAPTRAARVAALRRIRAPAAAKDLYDHWLKAERDALAAARELEHPTKTPEGDPLVPLTIAEGKITGYARRLGAHECLEPQAGTIPP